jgi:hypothetical protein
VKFGVVNSEFYFYRFLGFCSSKEFKAHIVRLRKKRLVAESSKWLFQRLLNPKWGAFFFPQHHSHKQIFSTFCFKFNWIQWNLCFIQFNSIQLACNVIQYFHFFITCDACPIIFDACLTTHVNAKWLHFKYAYVKFVSNENQKNFKYADDILFCLRLVLITTNGLKCEIIIIL